MTEQVILVSHSKSGLYRAEKRHTFLHLHQIPFGPCHLFFPTKPSLPFPSRPSPFLSVLRAHCWSPVHVDSLLLSRLLSFLLNPFDLPTLKMVQCVYDSVTTNVSAPQPPTFVFFFPPPISVYRWQPGGVTVGPLLSMRYIQ